jgi:hypothetical protein
MERATPNGNGKRPEIPEDATPKEADRIERAYDVGRGHGAEAMADAMPQSEHHWTALSVLTHVCNGTPAQPPDLEELKQAEAMFGVSRQDAERIWRAFTLGREVGIEAMRHGVANGYGRQGTRWPLDRLLVELGDKPPGMDTPRSQGPRRTVEDLLTAAEAAGLEPRQSGEGRWFVCCPCHDDEHGSLLIQTGEDGYAWPHCFAGCSQAEIVAALCEAPARRRG